MTGSELRAQLRAQQPRNKGVAQGVPQSPVVAYESCAPIDRVALQRSRFLENATAVQPTATRAVVPYDFVKGKGGLLIDSDGFESAVHELHWRYGNRVDWPALLRSFEAREHLADREAATLVRKLMAKSCYRPSQSE